MSPLNPEVFRQFFDTSPQAMWMYDLEAGRFLAVNQAACRRYGYSQDEFQEMTLVDVRPPEHADRLMADIHRTRDRGLANPPAIWEHQSKAGERIYVEVLATVVEFEGARAGFAVLHDVTRETILEKERNRLFELSQDIMTIRTLDGKVISVNSAVEQLLGWTPEEVAHMGPRELIHPEDSSLLPTHPVSSVDDGPRTRAGRIRNKEGAYRWMHWTQTVDLEGGRIYTVARDVTSEREMYDRLVRSEEKLRLAQKVSHVGSWSYDVGQDRLELSDEFYRITGHPPQSYLPTWPNVLRCIHPDDRYRLHFVRDAKRSPVSEDGFEVRVLLPSGDTRVAACLVESEEGKEGTSHFHGTVQDITERVQAQEAQRWLSEIVASSTEAIVGKTLDGMVLSWNRAAEYLFGYTAEEMVGRSLQPIFPKHRESELSEILSRLRRGDRIEEFETERCDREGRIIEVSVNISPVRTEAGKIVGAAAVTRDITAKKAAERQLANRLAQVTALHKIDLSIASTFDLRETLQVVASQTIGTTDVEAVHIFGLDRRSRQPDLLAKHDLGHSRDASLREETSCAMARVAMAERRADATTTSFALRSGLCDARLLVTKGEVRGIFVVHHRAVSARTSEASTFLDTLAGQAAIAIETVDLFQDLQTSHEDLKGAYDETLAGWSRALDLRDHETEGHSQRVTDITVRMATELGISGEDLVNVRRGALLHDIGKLGVPDRILLKPGPLTDEEWVTMRMHPLFGRDILAPIEFLKSALDIPLYHHEKWDGSGYPVGLAGEDIPLAARIFAFADVWDALTWPRPYRDAWPFERVRAQIVAEVGRHFDPSLVDTFLAIVDEYRPPSAGD